MKILSRPASESCSDCGRLPVSRRQGTTREQRSLYLPSWAAAASFPLWVTWELVRKATWQRHQMRAAWLLLVRWTETNHAEIKCQFRKNTQSSLLSDDTRHEPRSTRWFVFIFYFLEQIQDVWKTIWLQNKVTATIFDTSYEFIVHILLTC